MRERLYFPYQQLEEFQRGMWRIVRGEDRKRFATMAADLMRQPVKFKAAMMEAVDTWPISCAQNLTSENSNRIAWLGHAGCCIGVGSCEENTRIGWHMLSPPEQSEANRVAGEVLDHWIATNSEERQLALFESC
jgi:hypothetical protein